MDPIAREILIFWFGTDDVSAPIERRDVWFKSTPDFDRHIAETFSDVHERAAAGNLDRLMETAAECVALAIALDQFPRNLFRGSARAFLADPKAREVAREAIARGHDREVAPQPRRFFYLPFVHSEILEDQDLAVELNRPIADERTFNSIVAHRDAIARFGRFPHRNEVLGRPNTPEETVYLEDPPTWGMTAAEAAELERRKAAREQADRG